MLDTDATHFQAILHNWLEEATRTHNERDALVIEASSDELDRIQNAKERDFVIGNLERRTNRLHEIRAALARIEDGSYGLCLICEESIALKRLKAIPWAAHCVSCQEAVDFQQKTQGYQDAPSLIEAP